MVDREKKDSTKRLVEAGRARGHRVEVIDTLRCYMNMATAKPSIHYRGRSLDDFDAIIPRIGASISCHEYPNPFHEESTDALLALR